uniref:MobP2 family relaxase n=1 Tax=Carnobacterium sp. TaxID=48221 RepID=UPI00344F1272
MAKPSIILTSQFTVPTAQSFTKYMNYITRKESIEKNKDGMSSEETQKELAKINELIIKYDIKYDIGQSSVDKKKILDNKEKEALSIIGNKNMFAEPDTDYIKYIAYMSRNYALERKDNKTDQEKKEQERIRKKIVSYTYKDESQTDDRTHVAGLFTNNKSKLSQEDLEEAKDIVRNAQQNGSIFYQDVISFDTKFLIKEGILNPNTQKLNEERLKQASQKMMDNMFKDEKINNGFWIASIHRNTEHIHIHYGTVEKRNTRKAISVTKDGVEMLEPKGKRKQKTIDNMKSTFANTLVDRNVELAKISQLRNTLVQDIKINYQLSNKKDKTNTILINQIYEELPIDKGNWQYNNKLIKPETKEKINMVTNNLMETNPNYKEYIKKIEEEDSYRISLYGESNRSSKNYSTNKKDEIQQRLGNSLLKEMKNKNSTVVQVKNLKINNRTNHSDNKSKINYNKYNLYMFTKVLNDDYEKYRAEKDYEHMKQQILMEQERNSL